MRTVTTDFKSTLRIRWETSWWVVVYLKADTDDVVRAPWVSSTTLKACSQTHKKKNYFDDLFCKLLLEMNERLGKGKTQLVFSLSSASLANLALCLRLKEKYMLCVLCLVFRAWRIAKRIH